MKELVKWQIISFISRSIAMALGVLQSFVIIRLLSVSEWGIVQLGVSIGGAFGIYQHLGLASGSTREISSAKDDTEIFKIFVTATVIRYCATLPIALFLFFAASNIAVSKYSEPTLVLPVKIYALVLFFQGVQSMFNSVISGTKRFKQLFLYQSAIAIVSVFLYVPLVYVYKINGFFIAMAAFNLLASITLGIIAFKPLRGKLELPDKDDFKLLFKELLSISLAIYAVKVIYTWWEKSGALLLGLSVSKETVAFFAFALLYAKKLMMVSDSITTVNLPVLSEQYVKDFKNFKKLFTKNFDRVFVFIVFSAATAIYWSREIIQLAVGGNKYDSSLPLILPMVFAFVFYSFINIVKSSIVIPAKLIKEMIIGFGILLVTTVLTYFGLIAYTGHLNAMALGMVLGGLFGFTFLTFISQYKLGFRFFNHDHLLILIQGAVIAMLASIDALIIKSGVFIILMALYFWAIFIAGFIQKKDAQFIYRKVLSLKR